MLTVVFVTFHGRSLHRSQKAQKVLHDGRKVPQGHDHRLDLEHDPEDEARNHDSDEAGEVVEDVLQVQVLEQWVQQVEEVLQVEDEMLQNMDEVLQVVDEMLQNMDEVLDKDVHENQMLHGSHGSGGSPLHNLEQYSLVLIGASFQI